LENLSIKPLLTSFFAIFSKPQLNLPHYGEDAKGLQKMVSIFSLRTGYCKGFYYFDTPLLISPITGGMNKEILNYFKNNIFCIFV